MSAILVLDDDKPGAQANEGLFTSTPSNEGPVLGQWYWVLPATKKATDSDEDIDEDEDNDDEDTEEWLGCAMQVGSNFVEMHSPHSRHGYKYVRIHMEDFWTRLRHEPNPLAIINLRIAGYQKESMDLMARVQALTQRLGLTPVMALPGRPAPNSSGSELAVLSGQTDVKEYGNALSLAKNEQLPELFRLIEAANENLSTWMKAASLPMEASMEVLKGSIEGIDDRIFAISLYAGLAEECIKCKDGKPADVLDKLHVMQFLRYMDEECLANYDAGGMDFDGIRDFDDWITKPENLDRILPFPRTLVAMRVRRKTKERDSGGSMVQAFVNMGYEISDAYTFLYVRNGEQVFRLACEMDFGELIFPSRTTFNPLEPKMVSMLGDRVDEMMSVSEFEVLAEEYRLRTEAMDAWDAQHPEEDSWRKNPHRRHFGFDPERWQPVDSSNLYFDEVMKSIDVKVQEFNRIALIIQGLFDRSMVLHPHLPVHSWHQDGFEKAIKLVYDGSDVLHHGEAPDFEQYRAELNASIGTGSLVTGQQDYWLRKEGARESERLANDWRNKSEYRPTRFQPRGNPGPGAVAPIVKFSNKTKTAHFTWEREKLHGRSTYALGGDIANCNLVVPMNELLNVSAYKPGDYRQFFVDPRTRAQYLKWAPLMLAAEDFYGKQPAATHKSQGRKFRSKR